MGSQNVAKVFAYWTQKLTPSQSLALIRMALTAMDEHKPPVYWGGWQFIAESLGHDVNANGESARRQVTKVMTGLMEAGAVVSARNARPGSRHADYALCLDPDVTWQPKLNGGADKVAWERVPLIGPKESYVPPVDRDQKGPISRDQKGPINETQTVLSSRTELVPHRSSEEPIHEYRQEYRSPQVHKSPVATGSRKAMATLELARQLELEERGQ